MFSTLTRSKWISLVCLLLCANFYANAQVTQLKRLEIPINQDIEAYNVVPLDSSGIILYRSFGGPGGGQLELTKLDTSLTQLWKGYVTVPAGFTLIKPKTTRDAVYFFFKSYAQNPAFLVIAVSLADGRYANYSINNQVRFNPTEFAVSKNAVLIAGYFNFRPIVLHFSLKTGHSTLLPGFVNEPGELIQIKTYPDGNFDVVVTARNASRKRCIWIRHFDNLGELIQTVAIEPDENKNLIFGRVASTGNNNQIVAGVYGRSREYARGVFVADINSYGEYKIHYYNFADLKNFFHYMKAKREKRIKERIERRKIKGKRIKFNYRLMVHELIPYKDQFIMLGEAFYPRYSTRSYGGPMASSYSPWTYGMSNRVYSPYRSDMVFDGYQYTHAIAIGFDKQGELSWDNSFEIDGIKVFQLDQFVKIFPAQEHIVLAYMFQNKLRSKIIKGDQVVEGTLQDPIKTGSDDEIIDTRSAKLEYWYGNLFFGYGIQSVKSPLGGRRVFFINKLAAH